MTCFETVLECRLDAAISLTLCLELLGGREELITTALITIEDSRLFIEAEQKEDLTV